QQDRSRGSACPKYLGRYSRVTVSFLSRARMPLRSRTAWMAVLLVLLGPRSGQAAGFVDAAERYVVVPDRVARVMTVSQPADVLVFVLAPDKLMNWSTPPARAQRAYLPAKLARLPVIAAAADPAEAARSVAR